MPAEAANTHCRQASTRLRNRDEILVDYGVKTPQGLVRPPADMLTKTTVNRYLRAWGYVMTPG